MVTSLRLYLLRRLHKGECLSIFENTLLCKFFRKQSVFQFFEGYLERRPTSGNSYQLQLYHLLSFPWKVLHYSCLPKFKSILLMTFIVQNKTRNFQSNEGCFYIPTHHSYTVCFIDRILGASRFIITNTETHWQNWWLRIILQLVSIVNKSKLCIFIQIYYL